MSRSAVHAQLETRPPTAATTPVYEGLVTRALGFAVDAALIDLVALIVSVSVGLALSVLNPSDNLEKVFLAVGAVAYVLWSIAYFVTFWSTTGQTPGNRLLQIRVCRADDGGAVRPRKALLRLGAMVLCAIPLFAGFLPILVDSRRRGLHDMIAGSVVVSAPVEPATQGAARPAARRLR
jgi:uncharacterized RDD family membrane protein YckC